MTDHQPKLGFWSCWALTAGIMIGSGIFLLPSVLAPYGLMSFAGWALTAGGSVLIALIVARLASRTTRSGGVYVYTQDAFGDLPGFLIAWGYWAAYWISIPAIAIAFAGYMTVFIPGLIGHATGQAVTALALIWSLTLINMFSLKAGSGAQIIMALLKIIPLSVIIILGFTSGSTANLPAFNPSGAEFLPALATTALLTMWAFSGLEAGGVAAGDVKNPTRTIPRSIIAGTLTVAFIYIASTLAVMMLVPGETLAGSPAPFAQAAARLGEWGPYFIAVGALIATAGSLNGIIFVTGQMPMALAIDGLAPKVFAQRSKGGAPYISLIFGSILASVLLALNYSKGLVEAFKFLAMMATLAVLVPLLVAALADMKFSLKRSRTWVILGALTAIYSTFAILGSGLEVIIWGCLLFALGVPVYFALKSRAS